jgi:hypothetical protein
MTNIKYNGRDYFAVEIGGKITVAKSSDGGLDIFSLPRMKDAKGAEVFVKSYAISSNPVSPYIYPTRVTIGGNQHEKTNAAPQGTFNQPVTYTEPLKLVNDSLSFMVHNNDAVNDIDVYYYFMLYSSKPINQEGCEYSILEQQAAGALATEATLAALNLKVTACNTGAVVVASGAITETNSSSIKSSVSAMRNLASGTYHTEVSIKLTLNQAEQRIDEF